MNNCVLQFASGPHALLTASAGPLHQRMCNAHGLRYVLRTEPSASEGAVFDKVHLLYDWLVNEAVDGEVGVLLDADALWVWPWTKLTSALPEGKDVGMVLSTQGDYNSGAVYVRRTPSTYEYLKQVLRGRQLGAAGVGPYPGQMFQRGLHDQPYFNTRLATCPLEFASLNKRWNNWLHAHGDQEGKTVVRAWHTERMPCRLSGVRKLAPRVSLLLELYQRGINEKEFVHTNL